jgi:hypothetical protein
MGHCHEAQGCHAAAALGADCVELKPGRTQKNSAKDSLQSRPIHEAAKPRAGMAARNATGIWHRTQRPAAAKCLSRRDIRQ